MTKEEVIKLFAFYFKEYEELPLMKDKFECLAEDILQLSQTDNND